MAYPRSTSWTPHYCFQLWISYLWCGQRTCQNLKTPSRQVPPSYKQYPRLCGTGQTHHSSARGMPQLLWCVSPFHIDPGPNSSSLKNNKGSIGKGPHPQGQDSYGVNDIILLLEFCLKNTYFSFQGQFFEQVEGAAMGSMVSPIVANLYMKYLEQKALSTAPHHPSSGTGMWMKPLSS